MGPGPATEHGVSIGDGGKAKCFATVSAQERYQKLPALSVKAAVEYIAREMDIDLG
ncbi:hypothetical protein [Hymenobacter glacieicola]|nr:hypothetical protein [Hymenobacter glacieicola]